MKLFSKFVIGFGILIHQKISERLAAEVEFDRQSSPPDEGYADLVESGNSMSCLEQTSDGRRLDQS